MGMRIAAEPPSSPMNMGCSSLTPWRPPPRRCSFPRTRSFRSRMRRRTARSPHLAGDAPTDIRRLGARILVDDGKRGPFASCRIRGKTKGRNAPKTGHSKRACNRLQLAGSCPTRPTAGDPEWSSQLLPSGHSGSRQRTVGGGVQPRPSERPMLALCQRRAGRFLSTSHQLRAVGPDHLRRSQKTN
jgi:hypothetical protein